MKPYYNDERSGIVIYHGDCREILPHLKADVFVTDPPYGVRLKQRTTKRGFRAGSYTKFDDSPEYVKRVAVPAVSMMVLRGMSGALTPGLRCMWFYPRPTDMGVIWSPAGAGMTEWGFNCSQPIFYYGRDPFLAAGKGSRPNGVQWNNASEENGHPCPKPLAVVRWLVNRCCVSTETLIDPFMGSGTVLVAAKLDGRKAIGIEIEERYAEIAAKRLSQGVLQFDASPSRDGDAPCERQRSLLEDC